MALARHFWVPEVRDQHSAHAASDEANGEGFNQVLKGRDMAYLLEPAEKVRFQNIKKQYVNINEKTINIYMKLALYK